MKTPFCFPKSDVLSWKYHISPPKLTFFSPEMPLFSSRAWHSLKIPHLTENMTFSASKIQVFFQKNLIFPPKNYWNMTFSTININLSPKWHLWHLIWLKKGLLSPKIPHFSLKYDICSPKTPLLLPNYDIFYLQISLFWTNLNFPPKNTSFLPKIWYFLQKNTTFIPKIWHLLPQNTTFLPQIRYLLPRVPLSSHCIPLPALEGSI